MALGGPEIVTLQVFLRRRQAPVELCSRGGVHARRGPPGERAHEQQADEAAGQAQRARKHGVFILSLPPQMRTAARLVTFSLLVAGFASGVPALKFDPVVFEEVAASRGVRFVTNSSRSPRKHQPETMVSGVALFDYDNDGWLDIYVVNGAKLPGLEKSGPEYWNRLFRNNGDGTFQDVTATARVAGRGYDLGVATGDYDNDGRTDLFVAGLRRNTLFHNNGDGTFSDVTEAAGLARPDPRYGTLWAVAASFLDYDHDGRLDLFVSNYVVWDPSKEPVCGSPAAPDYCHPRQYQGLPNSLFHNNGDGTFSDVSVASGIRAHVGKGMGVAVADFDDDGWMDVFVANDTMPSSLFLNNRNGTFTEAAFERGVALTESAEVVSGMGADARDVDNDGLPDIFQTALVNETFPLFKNLGKAGFEDVTIRAGVAMLSRPRAGWGNGIVDLNNDGWKDLFAACADVMDAQGEFRERVPQANAVFVNLKDGRFADGGRAGGRRLRAQGGASWRRLRRHRQRRPHRRRGHRAGRRSGAVAQRVEVAEPLAAGQDRRDEEQPGRHGGEAQDRHRRRRPVLARDHFRRLRLGLRRARPLRAGRGHDGAGADRSAGPRGACRR